jgi:hypothetical protein
LNDGEKLLSFALNMLPNVRKCAGDTVLRNTVPRLGVNVVLEKDLIKPKAACTCWLK